MVKSITCYFACVLMVASCIFSAGGGAFTFSAGALTSAQQAEMDKVVENIMSGVKQDMTDLEKVYYLYSRLTFNYDYHRSSPNMHNAYGALVERLAVCDGFSYAYEILLNKAGIKNRLQIGVTTEGHMWNMVNIYGNWYHIDSTAGRFLVTDNTLSDMGYKWEKAVLTPTEQFFGDYSAFVINYDFLYQHKKVILYNANSLAYYDAVKNKINVISENIVSYYSIPYQNYKTYAYDTRDIDYLLYYDASEKAIKGFDLAKNKNKKFLSLASVEGIGYVWVRDSNSHVIKYDYTTEDDERHIFFYNIKEKKTHQYDAKYIAIVGKYAIFHEYDDDGIIVTRLNQKVERNNNKIVALDTETGEKKVYRLNSTPDFTSTYSIISSEAVDYYLIGETADIFHAVIHNDKLYFHTAKNIYSFDSKTGKFKKLAATKATNANGLILDGFKLIVTSDEAKLKYYVADGNRNKTAYFRKIG